jgi:uncharacterized iron-regulated protein
MRLLTFATGLAVATLMVACAGSSRGERPVGRTLEDERLDAEAQAASGTDPADSVGPTVPDDVVARAAAPLVAFRNADGANLAFEATMTHLASADAICIGERHDDPGDHFAQLRVIQALFERRAVRGFELGIGLEMVREPFQPVLTRYLDGGLSDAALEEGLHFQSEWGYDMAYYQPAFREASVEYGSLLAFGVPRDLTRDVAQKGLSGINPNQRRILPHLDLNVPGHRAVFDSLMIHHPGTAQREVLDRFYEAQVVWDESMADRAAAWLSQRYPGRKLVILAGAAHCHPSAIPARIKRRAAFTVVSVLPRAKDEPSDPSRNLLAKEYDYLLLREQTTTTTPAAPPPAAPPTTAPATAP